MESHVFLPNSFSYGVFANIGFGEVPGRLPGGRFREVPEGSRAGSEPRSEPRPGRFRGKFRITGSGAGSERQVPEQVPNHGFQEVPGGSGAGSGSGQVPGHVPIREFREVSGGRFRTTGFGGQGFAGTVPERFWPGF